MPKKSHHLSAAPLAGWYYAILCKILFYLLHVIHEKVGQGFEVATFKKKTLNFSLVIHLNWLAEIETRYGQLLQAKNA